ncbi:MAG: GNAT family N-acetyltransferase [Haloarculaceae archaeon]
MTVEVRPAKPADVRGIRAVARAAWQDAHVAIAGREAVEEFLAAYYDADSFRERIADDEAMLDVAVDGTADVVGYVFVTRGEGETYSLAHIYVDPERWGEGIGRQLLDHVETRVRERGGEHVSLGVMVENERARRFYEAAGYEKTDEFDDERLGVRACTYEKSLI